MKRSGPNDQVVATAHAILLGDRINTSGLEGETLSTSPLAIRIENEGIAVLFRYGVVVLIGLSQQQEQKLLEKLSARVSARLDRYEEETAVIKLAEEDEDQVPAGGPILVRAMSPERLLVISDVLAKSVVLAHDERRVAEVFEVIEPFARELATRGKARLNRTGILKLIGNALLVQHRVSGRVAITEKPDALTAPIWKDSTLVWKTSTSYRSASTRLTENLRSSPRPQRRSLISSTRNDPCVSN
jgi:required for meiotic nuclear division protein 1